MNISKLLNLRYIIFIIGLIIFILTKNYLLILVSVVDMIMGALLSTKKPREYSLKIIKYSLYLLLIGIAIYLIIIISFLNKDINKGKELLNNFSMIVRNLVNYINYIVVVGIGYLTHIVCNFLELIKNNRGLAKELIMKVVISTIIVILALSVCYKTIGNNVDILYKYKIYFINQFQLE